MIAVVLAFASLLGFSDQPAPCQFRLVASAETVSPGTSFWIAGEYTMRPEWHVYWRNPGDSGLPTHLDVKLPEGWKMGKLQWPFPHRFEAAGLMNYGYEKKVMLLAEVEVPPPTAPGVYTLTAESSWLACKEECVPGQGSSRTTVAVESNPQASPEAAEMEAFRSLVPIRTKLEVQGRHTKDGFELAAGPLGPARPDEAYFFADASDAVAPGAPQTFDYRDRKLFLTVKRSEYATKKPETLIGVLVVTKDKKHTAYEVAFPILN